jgi:hypothetical protein
MWSDMLILEFISISECNNPTTDEKMMEEGNKFVILKASSNY